MHLIICQLSYSFTYLSLHLFIYVSFASCDKILKNQNVNVNNFYSQEESHKKKRKRGKRSSLKKTLNQYCFYLVKLPKVNDTDPITHRLPLIYSVQGAEEHVSSFSFACAEWK